MNLKHTNQSYRELTNGRHLVLGIGASALSGVLIALSMPNFDLSFLAWFALVPLLIAIALMPEKFPMLPVLMATPCGIVWSVFVHIWYPSMFGAALGGFLILLVGWWYANLIGWGVVLQRKLPGALKVLAIPVVWSAMALCRGMTILKYLTHCMARSESVFVGTGIVFGSPANWCVPVRKLC